MFIIVIGCGKVGSGFAVAMAEEGHDVVIVDNDAQALAKLPLDFSGLKVTGVPIDQDVLKRAGIERADALAAVTPDDNINIMACQIAKEIYHVKEVIARIYNPARESVFHQFGLDTICPTNLTVEVIRSIVLGNRTLDRYTIGSNTLNFQQRLADKEIGKKVKDLSMRNNEMLFGIVRNNDFRYASPDLQILNHDVLVVSAKFD